MLSNNYFIITDLSFYLKNKLILSLKHSNYQTLEVLLTISVLKFFYLDAINRLLIDLYCDVFLKHYFF